MVLSYSNVARTILTGFHRHYRAFQAVTEQARELYIEQRWSALQAAARARISYYDQRVIATVQELSEAMDCTEVNEKLWKKVRSYYADLLVFHPQAELAETFFNSVFCKLFHRSYFNNRYIFVESVLAKRIPLPQETEYRAYFPVADGIASTLESILTDMNFGAAFADMAACQTQLMHAFLAQVKLRKLAAHQLRIDVLKHPFYRNKAAYVVGRIVTEQHQYPFVVPILNNSHGQLYVDALITDVEQMLVVFSFARAYFFVKTTTPSALVRFLQGLMPRKKLAELYSAIGLHKQGKTEFYRELLQHFATSTDQLVVAPGVRGLVMEVFTLPSFPYVFKVIRDTFGETKPFGRDTVLARYQLVKQHDRVGRMADTIEYSNVALPRSRFSAELLAELKQSIAGSMEFEGDYVVLKHVYIEKRLTPLNIYLTEADDTAIEAILLDYGYALKDMIAANIFPGDMLLKNFGVTRGKRVVFYDYDEVQYLTEMNFRAIPKSDYAQDVLASEHWYSVAPGDVFPEQVATFVFPNKKYLRVIQQHHPELIDATFWQEQQQQIKKGMLADIFPYPQSIRFRYQTNTELRND
ncbi:bifunctional isocitrate dehydrogenase kinase/phosphatase [Aliidiomarina quisquiliarum]|uniref:bifunctional isocitrate dehydrogenase kinase/phosphatase n=1 Tax=Aliidiomarina quisquiliarum TaxID=2938947 RepID=UPI00208FD736|nr:bifunctional isocitrate dehydrogenase kinase/phosphatase [Aliidiomarina quisquiliarum]MCO4322113.1 bifunctional isocitrate dehydrogenase kinase/phosphatase [Aliidiomarina quisquiliarum]